MRLILALLVAACAPSDEPKSDTGSDTTQPSGSTTTGTTPAGTTTTGTTSTGTTSTGTTSTGTTSTGTTSTGTTSTGTTSTGTTSTGSTTTPEPALELVERGEVVCADPGARAESHFVKHELGWVASDWTGLQGSGVAAGDLDGDGRLDVVRTRPDGLELWVDGPLGWEETGRLAHLSAARATALSVADYDSDGDLDLFVGCYGAPNLLLANDGFGNFVDVATQVGLERFPYLSLTSAWADLDLDGDLDLLVGNYAEIPPRPEASREPSRLYLGDGGSEFEDVSDWLPARVQDAYTFMNPFIDINGDGYPEIVSITDFFYLEPSAILVNEIGIGFTVDEFSGFQLGFNGMGIGIGDANDDGLPDFVQSSTGRLSLMLSTPMPDNPSGGLWIEYAGARGLAPDRDEGHTFGWGAEYVDIDNDGDLDVPMLWGYWDDFPNVSVLDDPYWAKDALWIADDEGLLVNRADEWGFADVEPGRGLVVADLDHDGWLDVVKGNINGPTHVLMQNCADTSWLGVELTDLTAKNRDAIGAKVRVVAGDRVFTRWLTAGGTGMFSAGPLQLHFGLDDIEVIDRLEVLWPDQTLSVFEDVGTRQYVEAIRRE